MSENNNKEGGIGLVSIIFLIFLTLKLGGWGVVATWSWWWVFSPIWIPVALVGMVVLTYNIFNK